MPFPSPQKTRKLLFILLTVGADAHIGSNKKALNRADVGIGPYEYVK